MPIPDFRTIMPVFLEYLVDLQEHTDPEITQTLAEHFGLTQEERCRFLPGGERKVFEDRVGWAKAELGMSGLIAVPRQGEAVITERGLALLQQDRVSLERALYRELPGADEAIEAKDRSGGDVAVGGQDAERYPREVMDGVYERLRRELAHDLLTRLHTATTGMFRRLVIDLLVAMGYGGSLRNTVRSLGATGDGGLEGTIRADRLGVDNIHVRAKRMEEPLGRRDIEVFDRAMQGKQVWRGILLTTSEFSREAVWSATGLDRSVVLVNGEDLAGLMIDHDVGVSTTAVYTVKDIDRDTFGEG